MEYVNCELILPKFRASCNPRLRNPTEINFVLLGFLFGKQGKSNCEVVAIPDLVSISKGAFSTPFLFDGAKRN
ncbi:MAG: hypothetical protein LUD79_05630, partial [Oscillospiraceae bacterium]|nr:hypothetical protein [Oscillospiraceae bacterium]